MLKKPQVVIIGGGFGGLYAAKKLGGHNFPVTLIDKQNFHLFQPLLYQVATGFLPPSDIASPLRSALAKYKTVTVIQDEVIEIEPANKLIHTINSKYSFDILIVATGVTHSYFGHEQWSKHAPGLKGISDSLVLRSQILSSFEAAERIPDDSEQEKVLTFVIVGGGPTGVELAGAISELAHKTLRYEFRHINPANARIILCEAEERILPTFHKKSADYAAKTLQNLGVEVLTSSYVVEVGKDFVDIKQAQIIKRIEANTIIWAAGVKASPLAGILRSRCHVELDKMGRIKVNRDLSIPGYSDVFVIGDLAHFEQKEGKPLPGVAPVAMQQGNYLAKLLAGRIQNKQVGQFSYFNKGNMAVIGKGCAVVEIGGIRLNGFVAWLAWAFVHIYFLIEFETKVVVFFHWAWNYLTNKRGSRLIPK